MLFVLVFKWKKVFSPVLTCYIDLVLHLLRFKLEQDCNFRSKINEKFEGLFFTIVSKEDKCVT